MLLFSIGLPGWLADWCDAVLIRLARELGGSVTHNSWPPLSRMLAYEAVGSTLDELGRTLVASDAEHLVFGVRQPDDALQAVLRDQSTRFLLVLDDPCEIAAAFLSAHGGDVRGVVRAVASSCALLDEYRALPGALVLDGGRANTRSGDLIEEIAAHLGIPVTLETVGATLWDLESRGLRTRPARSGLLTGAAAAGRTVSGALQGYQRYFGGEPLEEIVWTRNLFFLVGGHSPVEPVDVAGPGYRVIIFGPFIHLPPGSWNARVLLGFSEEAVGSIFMVDAYHAEHQLAAVSFQPPTAGPYTAEINFSLSDVTGQGLEIRVWVISDNAQGSVAFGQATLTPLGLRSSGAAERRTGRDFRAVLDV